MGYTKETKSSKETYEQRVERLKKIGFQKGHEPLNPYGRPRGKSIRERLIYWLDTHPKDMDKFIKHFVTNNRELTWQMLEGRPRQDITSAGERIMPIPILAKKVDDAEVHFLKENNGGVDGGGEEGTGKDGGVLTEKDEQELEEISKENVSHNHSNKANTGTDKTD